ncbi:hypothetical protein [Pseudalkalibacillus salsuginis]|uniref:hypothetical protein n=1 Tax=Pseudalkalibacillus salsuginis TaxID=2910972 RepID=UPI001F309BF2|nr:hypothetical protein [Pseudalkalibacillus salsuginis]MCF6412033.1 hypothetical protein [Pseudalkalibacillus salsuginis]
MDTRLLLKLLRNKIAEALSIEDKTSFLLGSVASDGVTGQLDSLVESVTAA